MVSLGLILVIISYTISQKTKSIEQIEIEHNGEIYYVPATKKGQ